MVYNTAVFSRPRIPNILNYGNPLTKDLNGCWPLWDEISYRTFSGGDRERYAEVTRLSTQAKVQDGLIGSRILRRGPFGSSMDTTASGSPIRADDQGQLSHRPARALTVACWVRVSAFLNTYNIFVSTRSNGNGHGWSISVKNDGTLLTDIITGGSNRAIGSAVGLISTNTWYHVAATYDGKTQKLFRNGVNVATTVYGTVQRFSGSIIDYDSATNNPLTVGKQANASESIHAQFNMVLSYDRILSEHEINQLYTNPMQLFYTSEEEEEPFILDPSISGGDANMLMIF